MWLRYHQAALQMMAFGQEKNQGKFGAQPGHNGIQDMSFKIIDCASNLTDIKKRESFWQYKLKTFSPNGLNERNVDTI